MVQSDTKKNKKHTLNHHWDFQLLKFLQRRGKQREIAALSRRRDRCLATENNLNITRILFGYFMDRDRKERKNMQKYTDGLS